MSNRIKWGLASMLATMQVASLAAGIRMDAPIGGWRNSSGGEESYTQEVHYPAVRVNVRPGQSASALIKGQILSMPKAKSRLPYTLVVNGAAMPQRIEEDGSFERPYAFSAGSNSVEMRSPDGTLRKRVQFYENYAGKARPRLRVILSWDSDETDLDLHVVMPDGQHVFYGNRVATDGSAQDVDVTTGYGPEIFSSPSPQKGQYLVYVNYYGAGGNTSDLTVAQVTLVTQEGTPNEKQQSFRIPMRKAGELTLVKQFSYP